MSRHEEMKSFFKKTLEDQTLIPGVRNIITILMRIKTTTEFS